MSVAVGKTKTCVSERCCCAMSCSLVVRSADGINVSCMVAKWKAVLRQNKEEEDIRG